MDFIFFCEGGGVRRVVVVFEYLRFIFWPFLFVDYVVLNLDFIFVRSKVEVGDGDDCWLRFGFANFARANLYTLEASPLGSLLGGVCFQGFIRDISFDACQTERLTTVRTRTCEDIS